jgi:hypothetical protein
MTPDSEDVDEFARWSALLADLCAIWRSGTVDFVARPVDAGQQPFTTAEAAELLKARPRKVSPAQRDDVALALRTPEPKKTEGTGTGFDAVQMVDAAVQHLLGLQALVESRTVALTVWPAARAVAEHVAHVAWLLEPGITPEARMARRWMARLAAAHRLRWMAGAQRPPGRKERAAKRFRGIVRQELLLRFPGANIDWRSSADPCPWNIAGETYPTLSAQSRLMANLGVTGLAGVYDMLCLVTHPNSFVLGELARPEQVGDYRQVIYRDDPDQWVPVVNGACLMVYRAAHVARQYFALDTSRLEAWYDKWGFGQAP